VSEKAPRKSQTSPIMRFAGRFIGGRRTVQVFMKVFSPIDRWLVPATNGRVSSAPGQVCVIESAGRRSGKRRRTPLLFMRDGENIVLVASYGGSQRHPAWYFNVKADPRVRVWAPGRNGRYVAHIAEGEERERLWQAVVEFYPGYGKYQTYTEREIQVFVLEPETGEEQGARSQ
jgi:deazaflavin-dependent oxidoreductase (nitroreductase family)